MFCGIVARKRELPNSSNHALGLGMSLFMHNEPSTSRANLWTRRQEGFDGTYVVLVQLHNTAHAAMNTNLASDATRP